MVTRRVTSHEASETTTQLGPPARTNTAREDQMIALAFDLAEKRIRAGTATSQEVVHWLKLGSSREKLEQQRLKGENSLIDAKIEAMASAKRVEELYGKALRAMREYSGQEPDPSENPDEH